MTATDQEIREFLEHAGVKGMKWGVRKSKSETGISRARGALIDKNDRLSNNIDRARAGEKYKLGTKAVAKVIGKDRQEKNWDKYQSGLKAQNERLKSGELLMKDRIALYGSVSIAELMVSVRPENRD